MKLIRCKGCTSSKYEMFLTHTCLGVFCRRADFHGAYDYATEYQQEEEERLRNRAVHPAVSFETILFPILIY